MGLIARLLGAKDHPKLDPCVFVLRVQRTNGGKTCLVEARSDQTFAELDLTIRRSLGYDTWDHCSGFFEGDPWESTLICEVYPDGSGPGEKLPLEMLYHKKIAECGWVYDFGDNLCHTVTIEDIVTIDLAKQYPRAELPQKRQSASRSKKSRVATK
jgi:hypothetical protein